MSVTLEYQTPSDNWGNDLSFYHWGLLIFFSDNLINIFRRKTCLLFLFFIKAYNKCYRTVVSLARMCFCSVFFFPVPWFASVLFVFLLEVLMDLWNLCLFPGAYLYFSNKATKIWQWRKRLNVLNSPFCM